MAGYFDLLKKRQSVMDAPGYMARNQAVAGAVGSMAEGFGSAFDSAPVLPAQIMRALRNAVVGTPQQAVAQSSLARPPSQFYPKQSAYDLGAAIPAAAGAGLGLAAQRGLAPSGGTRAMPNQEGMINWHGSRQPFEKFDDDKMGTGTGAQTYGWGHYTGDRYDTAHGYRQGLAQGDLTYTVDGTDINDVYDKLQDAAQGLKGAPMASMYERLSMVERVMMH